MARRSRPGIYSGATGRIDATKIARLDRRRFVLQPKRDGSYVTASFRADGTMSALALRGGDVSASLLAEFRGCRFAPGIFHGEIEAHTEAGNRVAETNGARRIHLFDCARTDRDLTREPYRVRRDAMFRAWGSLEEERPWTRDRRGRAHDNRTGAFTPAIEVGAARFPIVPQLPVSAYDQAMSEWVNGDDFTEGLCVIDLDAPMGKGKSKHKIVTSIEAVCLDVDASAATFSYAGHTFATSARGKLRPRIGEVWEVGHEGFYERSITPRFARLVRRRDDLVQGAAP